MPRRNRVTSVHSEPFSNNNMALEPMTKAMLEKMISENSDRIAFEVNENGKSDLWKLFYLVNVDGNRKAYACCSMCSSVVAHSQRTGTGSLLRHKCAQFLRETLQVKPKTEPGTKPESIPKAAVEELIREQSSRVALDANEKGTSHLWQIFKLVTIDGKREPYACCTMCGAVVVYSVKTGTGSLLRHKCSQMVEDNGPATKRKSKKFEGVASKSSLCEKRQDLLAFKAMKYIAKDLQPLNVVEDPGFRELAQSLIDFGADFGKMPIDDVFTNVDAIALAQTHIPRMYQDIKLRLAVLFCASDFMAFTTDLWTNGQQKPFISLTAHLITEDFELHRLALGTHELGDRKTGCKIRSTILSIIAQYTGDVTSAEEKMKSSIFVTDTNADIVTALENPPLMNRAPHVKAEPLYKRLACGCDAINLILNYIFEIKVYEIVGLAQVLCDCQELVDYFKKSGLNSKLARPLKYEGLTKWNSVYAMVEGVHSNYSAIHRILDDRDELQKLEVLPAYILKELEHFLEMFRQCCDSLSAERRPTIQEYSLWSLKLRKHCETIASESQTTKQVKGLALQGLELQFKTDTIHNVALLLNPNFKSLRVLPCEDKIQATATVIELINAEEARNANEKDDPLQPEESVVEPPMKKFRVDQTPGEFDEFMDICNENSTGSSDELNRYLEKRVSPAQPTPDKSANDKSRPTDGHEDVLEFWKSHRLEFPSLSRVARHVLAIPASATTGERAGNILQRRVHLSPDYVDQVLFLHQNL